MKPCKITVDLYNTFRERMPEYVQYDRNVPLEITVLENGKPADLNGLFGRLLVSKPDGHEVYSNDVEINGNVITTTLGEQVFTASGVAQVTVDILDEQNSKRALVPFGMRIRSAVITDESIKSSNDYQTITALISDVRALNAMFHVEQEQRAEAFNAQMQSQEATFTEAQRQFLADHREAMFHVEQQTAEQADMFHVEQAERAKAFEQSEADREQRFEAQTTEWAQTVEQAEATRQFNEERRQSAENKRESAEKARESAERQRVDTEAVRQRQEQERGQGEAGRATAEANRVKAEQTRVDNESSRKSAESSRVNAESQRTTAESHRATAETSRVNAESQRATAETNRAGAEGRRSEAESSRVTAESGRVTAESQRITAENTREAQENARREAEEDRATRMAQWEAKAEETAQKAQEAVDSAQAFVNTNEERLLTDRDKIDYWGNHHANMKDMTDATVDKILGDFNTLNHTGEYITATETIARHVPRGTLKGHTEVNCIQEPSGADIVLPYDFEPGYGVTINDTKETGAIGIELQGQTLVNLLTHAKRDSYGVRNLTELNGQMSWDITENWGKLGFIIYGKPNTTYFLIWDGAYETLQFYLRHSSSIGGSAIALGGSANNRKFVANENGIFTLTFEHSTAVTGAWIKNPILLEYQEGMENWDIPYFTGMASVTTPTVTTTGSNLINLNFSSSWDSEKYNYEKLANGYVLDNTIGRISYNRKLENLIVGEVYTFSCNIEFLQESDKNKIQVYFNSQNKSIYGGSRTTDGELVWTFTYDQEYEAFGIYFQTDGNIEPLRANITNIRINNGGEALEYEPFKSSSLTLPEEIVLRSLPNGVCDTYNVQTGEYVQRIKTRRFNGTESYTAWSASMVAEGMTGIYVRFSDDMESSEDCDGQIICDTLPTTHRNQLGTCQYNAVIKGNNYIGFVMKGKTTEEVKQWLSENPTIVQHGLTTPIVTKVPLSQVLKSWNTLTHINTSIPENSLKPIIAPVNPSYEVMLKPSTQYSIITNPIANGHASTPIEFNLGGATAETVVGNGCTLITTPSTLANNKLEMSGRGQKLQGGVMVLEGNKTGMMFSHFDGMKSVENLTVRVNNANLIDKKGYCRQEQLIFDSGHAYKRFAYIQLKPRTEYVLTLRDLVIPAGNWNVLNIDGDNSDVGYATVYNYNRWNITTDGRVGNVTKIFMTDSTGRVRFSNYTEGGTNVTGTNYGALFGNLCSSITLQESQNTGDHIPQESNSLPLTIPMRSLPNGVCDTLDLLTGEYVQKLNTTRLTSGVITSAQGWYAGCNGQRNQHKFNIKLPADITNAKKTSAPLCDKFVTKNVWSEGNYGHDYISTALDSLFFVVDIDSLPRLEVNDNAVNRLKNYLDTEEVHLTYELAEPVVTQLDLQWEDGKLFAYDGTTHFFVDVEGGQLMPILDIDVPVNLAQRTSRLCAEKAQLEAEKAQLANEVSVLQLRNAMLQGEVSTLEQSNKNLQKEQEKLDKDNQELAHAVTIVDEHREEGDLELLSSDFDFELRLMEIEFAVGIPMMANYKGVRNMARTPYDMAKALILGGKYEREEMMTKLDRFEKLGSITADQKAELVALMDAVELTQ